MMLNSFEWLPVYRLLPRAVFVNTETPSLRMVIFIVLAPILTNATFLFGFNLVIDFTHVFKSSMQLRPLLHRVQACLFYNCNIFIDYVLLTAMSTSIHRPLALLWGRVSESQGSHPQCQTGHTVPPQILLIRQAHPLTFHEAIYAL